MRLPSSSDSPNPSPNPVNASAVADSVWFSLIGSTFSAIAVTVSNSVLNSVATADASITSPLEIRCGEGFSGELKDMYLFPNTVVALIWVSTFAGMNLEVVRVHIEGELGFLRGVDVDQADLRDPADLHPVERHLGTRVDHKARARRQQGQLLLVRQVAAELQKNEPGRYGGDHQQHRACQFVGRLVAVDKHFENVRYGHPSKGP